MITVYYNPSTDELLAFRDTDNHQDMKDNMPEGTAIVELDQEFKDIVPEVPDEGRPKQFILNGNKDRVIKNPAWKPVYELDEVTEKLNKLQVDVEILKETILDLSGEALL